MFGCFRVTSKCVSRLFFLGTMRNFQTHLRLKALLGSNLHSVKHGTVRWEHIRLNIPEASGRYCTLTTSHLMFLFGDREPHDAALIIIKITKTTFSGVSISGMCSLPTTGGVNTSHIHLRLGAVFSLLLRGGNSSVHSLKRPTQK